MMMQQNIALNVLRLLCCRPALGASAHPECTRLLVEIKIGDGHIFRFNIFFITRSGGALHHTLLIESLDTRLLSQDIKYFYKRCGLI